MNKVILWLMVLAALFQVHAEQAQVFVDTEMDAWAKAFTTDAITNITLAAKASGGNPDAFGEWSVLRGDGGGFGGAKVKENEAVGFRLDLQEFYSTYNAVSIDSITISMDVRYGIGNANVGFRKYLSDGTFVTEGFTIAYLGAGNPAWETESITFDADASSFSSNASQMTFDNEPCYYTFSLIFFSNTTAEKLIGQFDNFTVTVSYTPASPVDASFLNIEPASENQVKLTIAASGDLSACTLVACSNLTDAIWTAEPHSDDGMNGFITTNLAYSTSENSNVVIYVEAAEPEKFYGLQF